MDFASEYVVENTGIDNNDDYLLVNPSHQEAAASVSSVGYEAAIMSFEEEDQPTRQNQQQSIPPTKLASNTVKFAKKTMIQEPPENTLPLSQKIQCSSDNCETVLSHIDQPVVENGKTIWKCQFCGQKQEVGQWPNFDNCQDILYTDGMISDQTAPQVLEQIPPQDSLVVFVIDTSGSMSSPVMGAPAHQVAGLNKDLQEIIQIDWVTQMTYIPEDLRPQIIEMPASVQVNRIQTVKDGLITQLRKMSDEQRVGLISFSSQVEIYGDCSEPRRIIHPQDCENFSFEQLTLEGENRPGLRPLSETREKLLTAIKELQDEGQTALGPALTVAVAMAKKVRGSKVIVCTGGVATSGLGNEDSSQREKEAFYDSVSSNCKSDGVSVSVVSFDDCGMADRFGSIPHETGGQVERVSFGHSAFQKALEKDLNRQTFATNVQTRFSVGRNMYIEVGDETAQKTVFKFLGNINLSTQQCYSFAFLPNDKQDEQMDTQQSEQDPDSISSFHVVPPPPRDENIASTSAFEEVQSNANGRGVNESTPFVDDDEENTIVESGMQTTTDERQRAEQDEAIRGALTVKQMPFQYEVNFVTMRGVKGCRIWTCMKPITTSMKKAVESANLETMVSNSLQNLSKEILQKRKTGNLMESCNEAAMECERLKKMIRESDPQKQGLLHQVTDFKEKVLRVFRSQRLDEETATEFRKRENGQLRTTTGWKWTTELKKKLDN